MPRLKAVIITVFLGLALLTLSPANLSAQVFNDSSFRAEAAILSAGSKAAAIARLKSVRSVGVVNLSFRNVPRFRSKASAGKNYIGIKRLRAALAANPATRRALADRGISIGRVVGVDVYSSGAIRLYVL